jgi:nitrous oxide reductase accessory protein NosL
MIKSRFIFFAVIVSFALSGSVFSAEDFNIEHPIKNPPKYSEKTRCDNCGMDMNKWARTRYEFQMNRDKYHTCSIFCVAAMSAKLKAEPSGVRAAEYLHPEKMLDANKAYYVIGSTAPGTMTRTSKIAFSSKQEAEKFAAKYGGSVSGFGAALAEVKKEIHKH